MAQYHCQFRPIQRSKRRSVIQVIAYVTGLKLRSPRTGKCYRRRTPGDVVKFGCVGSKLPMQNLWALAESAEKRKNSIEGRHLIVALPRENSHEQQWQMLMEMAAIINQMLGVPVAVALHDNADEKDKPRNPHGHLVFAARVWLEQTQSFLGKTRALDVATTGSVIIENLRAKWEDIVNQALPFGIPKVSRLSHERAGRKQIPRRHLSEQAMEMERKGIRTRQGNYNRKVDQLNRVTAQRIEVENILNPLPALSQAERQRQLGLERELAIADALIADLPPARRKSPAENLIVVNDSEKSGAEQAVQVAAAHSVNPRTICSRVVDRMALQDEEGTQPKEASERGHPAIPSQLLALSLEEELRLASEALDGAPRQEKDLSLPL